MLLASNLIDATAFKRKIKKKKTIKKNQRRMTKDFY